MPHVVAVANLREELQKYIDPDGGTYDEEINAYNSLLLDELAKTPDVTQVIFWDSDESGDPPLDLSQNEYLCEELVKSKDYGLVYSASGSYYGATMRRRRWSSQPTLWAMSLWFGGSPLNSAPGFHVIPVT
jgi:hypothetical protein